MSGAASDSTFVTFAKTFAVGGVITTTLGTVFVGEDFNSFEGLFIGACFGLGLATLRYFVERRKKQSSPKQNGQFDDFHSIEREIQNHYRRLAHIPTAHADERKRIMNTVLALRERQKQLKPL